jgi:hypothetical protein
MGLICLMASSLGLGGRGRSVGVPRFEIPFDSMGLCKFGSGAPTFTPGLVAGVGGRRRRRRRAADSDTRV